MRRNQTVVYSLLVDVHSPPSQHPHVPSPSWPFTLSHVDFQIRTNRYIRDDNVPPCISHAAGSVKLQRLWS